MEEGGRGWYKAERGIGASNVLKRENTHIYRIKLYTQLEIILFNYIHYINILYNYVSTNNHIL